MSLRGFLARLTGLLEEAQVPYMLSGSIASTFYSAPRTTQDIDIVVALDGTRLRALLALLPEDELYFSQDAARDALRRRSMFNIIDLETGWKADLIVQKGRRFSEVEFHRRVQVDLLGLQVWMVSPEDCVISKLEWARQGESERQLRDVRGVLATQGEALDRGYIAQWVIELGLQDQWATVMTVS